MRKLLTASDKKGRDALRTMERRGRARKADKGVWLDGGEAASDTDAARAAVVASGGIGAGALVAVLFGLDAVTLADGPAIYLDPTSSARRPGAVRRHVGESEIITRYGIRCTTVLRALLDLAAFLDDDRWEQALESALRTRLVRVEDVAAGAADLRRRRRSGGARIERVLARRGPGVPPTGSILETLMVQLIRLVAGLPPPTRQLRIENRFGEFVARVDLCWPALGLFIELDGQGHKGQPVYDASRQTAVTAATGWLCGRFTWHEVVRTPRTAARRLADLVAQCERRPVPA